MINEKNILQHELIGLTAKVDKSLNPLSKGISGKVVDETTHTLVIGEKRVFKRASQFIFNLPSGKKVEVKGSLLDGKPWDRVKKK